MDGSFLGEDALFKCLDCGTTLMIPTKAWDVAEAKRTTAKTRRHWTDELPAKARR